MSTNVETVSVKDTLCKLAYKFDGKFKNWKKMEGSFWNNQVTDVNKYANLDVQWTVYWKLFVN